MRERYMNTLMNLSFLLRQQVLRGIKNLCSDLTGLITQRISGVENFRKLLIIAKKMR